MKRIKNVVIFSLVAIAILIASFYGGRYIILKLVRKQITTEIEKLHQRGTDISYDSLYLNSWSFIRIEGLIIQQNNSTHCSTPDLKVYVPEVEFSGLAILPLIINKTISFTTVDLRNPQIQYKENFSFKHDKNKKGKLRGLHIGKLVISHGKLEVVDSVTCDTLKRLNSNLSFSDISVNNMDNTFLSWSVGKMIANAVKVEFLKSFYTLTIKTIAYQSIHKDFRVDSLQLTPRYDKHTFALKTGHQTDRVVCTMPSLKASGFAIETLTRTKLHAECISLNVNLEAFRDKRYPFPKKKHTLLPVTFLHQLKFLLQIDTLKLLSSRVEYEEVSEKGTEPGRVFFSELTATIGNISNGSRDNTTMHARANFMDAGILNATFTFPSDPRKHYFAKGEIHNFSLPKINPMLKPIASAEIEKGDLVEMKFHFKYNEDHSEGEVLLDYTRLKMSSLKRDTHKERKFVTLLLNTLVRNNMDDNVSKAKKTGTILFYRDKQKSIFNYWWKSILSGIKSVYNLDKIMDTDGKKD